MIMIGSIEMGSRMGGQGHEFQCPTQAAGQLAFCNPREKILHLLASLGVVDIVNLGNHHGWITGKVWFDTDAQVHKTFTAHHRSSLSNSDSDYGNFYHTPFCR